MIPRMRPPAWPPAPALRRPRPVRREQPMLLLAGLGVDPWDVLQQGLSRRFGLGVGTWAIIVGAGAAALDPAPSAPGVRHAQQRGARRTRDRRDAGGRAPGPWPPRPDRGDARRRRAERDRHRGLHRRRPRTGPARRADDRTRRARSFDPHRADLDRGRRSWSPAGCSAERSGSGPWCTRLESDRSRTSRSRVCASRLAIRRWPAAAIRCRSAPASRPVRA